MQLGFKGLLMTFHISFENCLLTSQSQWTQLKKIGSMNQLIIAVILQTGFHHLCIHIDVYVYRCNVYRYIYIVQVA